MVKWCLIIESLLTLFLSGLFSSALMVKSATPTVWAAPLLVEGAVPVGGATLGVEFASKPTFVAPR